MKKQIVEENNLIATRVPPGDNWELISEKGSVVKGLTQVLTRFISKTGFKGNYRLEPLNSKLFSIVEKEVDIEEPEEEKWDLYGEGNL